jgi:predicted nucleic acid-binding protein
MACLDTPVLLDLAGRGGKRRRDRAYGKLQALIDDGQSLFTTRFNVAELYVGVYRSRHPEHEERTLAALLDEIGVLEFDESAARLFGQLTAHLQTIGRPAIWM